METLLRLNQFISAYRVLYKVGIQLILVNFVETSLVTSMDLRHMKVFSIQDKFYHYYIVCKSKSPFP